jgi:hypothetical protein
MTLNEINSQLEKAAVIMSATDKNIRQPGVHIARQEYFEALLDDLNEWWRDKARTTYMPSSTNNLI